MMWPVVPPLHAAGFAVMIIDARCHGSSDDKEFTSMPRFAEGIAAGLVWLRLQPDIAGWRCWATRSAPPLHCCMPRVTTPCGRWSACPPSPTRVR